MSRSASDVLSLTLPSRTRTRTRRRQWKRPPKQFWWFVFVAGFCVVAAVWCVLTGDWPYVGPNLATAAIQWSFAWRIYAGRLFNLDLAMAQLAVSFVTFGLIIAGVQ